MPYPACRRLLDLAILAVATHSVALGVLLLGFPSQMLTLVGWEYGGPVFWPSQAGLFLIILGIAYSGALRLRSLGWLLVGSKACAFVFLMAHALWLDAPRMAVLLAAVDGSMGVVVALLLWLTARAEPGGPDGGTTASPGES